MASGTLWDNCGLLNLLATQQAHAILTAHSRPAYTLPLLLTQAQKLRDRETGEWQPVEPFLTPLLEENLLRLIEPTQEEENLAVVLAQEIKKQVGNADLYASAVAISRNWRIASDDKHVRQLLALRKAENLLWTTPEWLQGWQAHSNIPDSEIRTTIENIRFRAKFDLKEKHPHATWWKGDKE